MFVIRSKKQSLVQNSQTALIHLIHQTVNSLSHLLSQNLKPLQGIQQSRFFNEMNHTRFSGQWMISRNLSSNTYEQSKENFKKSAILFDSFLRDPQVKYSLWHIPTPLNPKKIKGPLQMSAWGTKEHNSFFSLLHYMFLLDFSFLCLSRANRFFTT